MSISPGSAEWHARVKQPREQEATQPEQWWWLSFSAPGEGWRGGCCVWARGFTLALDEANRLGINPHGECKGEPLGPVAPPDVPVNQLLTKADTKMEKW